MTNGERAVVERFLLLEDEFGKGNVFVRWMNGYWFIIYKAGEENYSMQFNPERKINSRILNSLVAKGFVRYMDIDHKEVEDTNKLDGKYLLGGTLVVE